jgi:hypothetical protein
MELQLMNPTLPLHPDAEARLRMLEHAVSQKAASPEQTCSDELSEIWRESPDGEVPRETASEYANQI